VHTKLSLWKTFFIALMKEPDHFLSHFEHVPSAFALGANLLCQVLKRGLPFLTPKFATIFSEHSQQTKYSGCHFSPRPLKHVATPKVYRNHHKSLIKLTSKGEQWDELLILIHQILFKILKKNTIFDQNTARTFLCLSFLSYKQESNIFSRAVFW